ncbi:tyrosine--tRNA ligase, partial [Succinimonas sp.]|uniref:tyrosine--tRNA ligase n=1 Tax=Succinimonas sp. TaxID=1936151 RepID=UPI00386C74F3
KEEGMEPQVVMMMPLLVGLDGVKKMSKSAGNYIGVHDAPNDMFGKIMSISDDLMWNYYDLLSRASIAEIQGFKDGIKNGTVNPRDVKVRLAKEIIARFHSAEDADKAEADFVARFSKNAIPDDVPEVSLSLNGRESVKIGVFLREAGLVASSSDGLRMVKQNAVKRDGAVISDPAFLVEPGTAVWQVGKRHFAKVTLS